MDGRTDKLKDEAKDTIITTVTNWPESSKEEEQREALAMITGVQGQDSGAKTTRNTAA